MMTRSWKKLATLLMGVLPLVFGLATAGLPTTSEAKGKTFKSRMEARDGRIRQDYIRGRFADAAGSSRGRTDGKLTLPDGKVLSIPKNYKGRFETQSAGGRTKNGGIGYYRESASGRVQIRIMPPTGRYPNGYVVYSRQPRGKDGRFKEIEYFNPRTGLKDPTMKKAHVPIGPMGGK